MAKRGEIKVVGYWLRGQTYDLKGKMTPEKMEEIKKMATPLADLTPEEMEEFRQNISRRMSKALSEYYSNHPDEYIRFLKSEEEREKKEQESA